MVFTTSSLCYRLKWARSPTTRTQTHSHTPLFTNPRTHLHNHLHMPSKRYENTYVLFKNPLKYTHIQSLIFGHPVQPSQQQHISNLLSSPLPPSPSRPVLVSQLAFGFPSQSIVTSRGQKIQGEVSFNLMGHCFGVGFSHAHANVVPHTL